MDFLPFQNIEYTQDTYIKVIGVGGGGCNAVNYLYHLGLNDVSFLVCNTDRQALLRMDVPSKLQLGEGLGAGGEPERAEKYAKTVIPLMNDLREAVDSAETITAANHWPFPTYIDLMFRL